jgi:hypothetical protein
MSVGGSDVQAVRQRAGSNITVLVSIYGCSGKETVFIFRGQSRFVSISATSSVSDLVGV